MASSSWLVLGRRGFSVGKVTSLSVATESGSLAAATGVLTPWVAYADKALQNRVVIRKWNVISSVWEDVGGVDVGTIGTAMSSGAARDINLLLLPPLHLDTTPDARLTPLVTYIVHTNAIDSKAIARTFDGSKDTDTSGSDGASRAWPTVGSNGLLGFSIGRATGLVGAPARLFTPDAQGEERVQLLPEVLVAYQDASQGSKLMVENVRLLSSEGISSSSVCGETPYPTPMESTRAPTPRPTPQPSSTAPTPRAVTRGPTATAAPWTPPAPAAYPTPSPTASAQPTSAPPAALFARDAAHALEEAVKGGELAERLLLLNLQLSAVTLLNVLELTDVEAADGTS